MRALPREPYNLRVVWHSLGGLVMLIHCIQRVREGRPHHVRRLILLSPAGFHMVIPRMFQPLVYVWRPAMWYFKRVWRQQAFPVHLPTFMARLLAFKLTIDTSKLPAVGDLLQSIARLLLGGDRSAWDRALLMPHYAAAGMPLLSSWQVHHFIQLYTSRRCQLYDHGSAAANVAAYQQPQPPVLSECFHALRGVPVHLVAGQHDGVIPPVNIRCHYEAMQAAGVDVSYREFDYGHMDFTFSAKEELGYYVSSLLSRT
uniref:AB hydrolase-1 domain-containing protein n=1 Tax=Tetradesmus obliquus TaxID=3088 RepID=A0A383VBJ4_TETOB|eukprot:jgi/Sobl393_1/14030/SZX62132.1